MKIQKKKKKLRGTGGMVGSGWGGGGGQGGCERKTKFLIYVKLVLISSPYCILIYCYVPLLPHKKRGRTDPGLLLGPS